MSLRVLLTLATWLLLAHWAACLFPLLGFLFGLPLGWYQTSWALIYWRGLVTKTTFCEGDGSIVWSRSIPRKRSAFRQEEGVAVDDLGALALLLLAAERAMVSVPHPRYIRALFWATPFQ